MLLRGSTLCHDSDSFTQHSFRTRLAAMDVLKCHILDNSLAFTIEEKKKHLKTNETDALHLVMACLGCSLLDDMNCNTSPHLVSCVVS